MYVGWIQIVYNSYDVVIGVMEITVRERYMNVNSHRRMFEMTHESEDIVRRTCTVRYVRFLHFRRCWLLRTPDLMFMEK